MNQQLITLGILQLARVSTKQIQKSKITKNSSYLFFNYQTQFNNRDKYNFIERLAQDFYRPIQQIQKLYQMKKKGYNIQTKDNSQWTTLPLQTMRTAIDRQDLVYLPQNHPIQVIQFYQYQQKYNISKYSSIKNQVRFCLTILSHNNIQHGRYKKVIDTVIQQKYQNYHIVFIDDNSDDQNMKQSIRYFKQKGFPKNKITYIQNIQRNYATYNFLNAAYNYCDQNDIQMLLDGDDQIIGKYSFQIMNIAYQNPNQQVWFAYSGYKQSDYIHGLSKAFDGFNNPFLIKGRRQPLTRYMGVIRTWNIKLLYNIPPKHHKLKNGKYWDTLYDAAVQDPLVQLCGPQRVKFMPQMLYNHNINYGGGDSSTKQKRQHRQQAFKYMLKIRPLKHLDSLEGTIKNPQISKQLQNDLNKKYIIIK